MDFIGRSTPPNDRFGHSREVDTDPGPAPPDARSDVSRDDCHVCRASSHSFPPRFPHPFHSPDRHRDEHGPGLRFTRTLIHRLTHRSFTRNARPFADRSLPHVSPHTRARDTHSSTDTPTDRPADAPADPHEGRPAPATDASPTTDTTPIPTTTTHPRSARTSTHTYDNLKISVETSVAKKLDKGEKGR